MTNVFKVELYALVIIEIEYSLIAQGYVLLVTYSSSQLLRILRSYELFYCNLQQFDKRTIFIIR